ncbi:MAG TPA: HlyD family efflux transporter periplasmic adaptor subunit [Ruminococcus sp.]|nr:HlyD family efflux transporter periplasmic adaptor subunit [Ruminococcus sp.]
MRVNRSDSILPIRLLRDAVLILIIIVFISIAVNFFRNREAETVVALMAEAHSSKEFKGVFIRDEEVLTYSGDGVLSYNVADGGKLGINTVIAQVYPTDEQISVNREKAGLTRRLEILKKIQNPGTLQSAQPASLSANIEESYRSLIYCRDMKNYPELKNLMDDLIVDMSTYQIITGEVTDFSKQISDINDELAQLEVSSVKPKEQIKSSRSAYFASYADGYEFELGPDSINTISIREIEKITDRRSTDKTVVGKLIDGYGWYLAGVIDNSKKEYNIGESVKLRFDSGSDTYDAVIKNIRDEGDPARSIFIIECSAFNYDLVQHRTETAELIKNDVQGLKVPRDAIRFADVTETVTDPESGEVSEKTVNCKGVYIMKGEQVEFKKIDVKFEGSNYVLSKTHDNDKSYLALYDNILIEGVEADEE